jgi:AcrR family transcriptional regulator
MAERHVHPHASVVDALVDTVVRKLISRQRPQALTDRPHRPHVLRAVFEQVLHVLLGVLEGRYAALPHQRRTAMVFLHRRAREPADVLKRARRTVGARLRGRAIELLQTRLGHLEVRAEHIPEDEPLEGGVMGGDGVQILDAIPHGLRERLVGRPDLHVLVVDRPRHAKHPRRRVLSVSV